jgi:hypothetical protein
MPGRVGIAHLFFAAIPVLAGAHSTKSVRLDPGPIPHRSNSRDF